LNRLLGLVKFLINHQDGVRSLEDIAAAMAHSSDTVLVGLRRLEAMGYIRVEITDQGAEILDEVEKITLSWSSKGKVKDLKSVDQILNVMLAETAAYRTYFRKADLTHILRI
jgi:hypothetical protein